MRKRLQNRIAESGLTLPVMVVYALTVWLLAGMVTQGRWLSMACFAASVYLMVELSNSNALLRVRSRMVSGTFIALSCMMVGQPGLPTSLLAQLCFITAFLILFRTYQLPRAPGLVYYAFLFIGLASLPFVRSLFFVPVLWLLMATQLQSFSLRSAVASVLGLATPYWFACLWFIYQRDFAPLLQHFSGLVVVPTKSDYASLSLGQLLVYAFTAVAAITGMVHFWKNSFEDKIRIRLLYGFFTSMTWACLLFIALQPQHYDVLIHLTFVCASPLIAHYLTLTSTRISNLVFMAMCAVALAITVVNLWSLSPIF